MDSDTVDFYDEESSKYSIKRYPKTTRSYTQFLFKKRLEIFLNLLEKVESSLPEDATILEIGCADGVVLSAVERRFPKKFSSLVGIDISPNMIEVAKIKNTNERASFLLRQDLPNKKFDVVIELGVGAYEYVDEWKFVTNLLKENGSYFYSLAGSQSLFTKIKNRNAPYIKYYKTYKGYESILSEYFSIKKTQVYGLFIPWLWKIPFVGRLLQPIFDFVFQKITPELFHEKIYLLQNNTNYLKASRTTKQYSL